MQKLSGYQIKEQQYVGRHSVICRGKRLLDDQPVILKLLKTSYPSNEQISLMQREFEIAQLLPSDSVVQNETMIQEEGYYGLVMNDFGGESLDQFSQKNGLSLSDFFQLSLLMGHIVHQLHRHSILHKDINLSHFIWNPSTNQLKITDFGCASELSQEQPRFRPLSQVEGTLAYISPEQTGRMNRAIDYRSDFYSLGASFYELLAGHPPFRTQDTLELIHAHLALPPEPLSTLKPEIPEPLSDLVLKLLAKDAEDRYQSIHGLKQDLMRCWEDWQTNHTIRPFVLGSYEVIDQFQLPQRLYGRTQEVHALLSALKRVTQGESELCLITGPAGIGKTSLVQEIYQALTLQRGYFISGKFDQLKRNIPYVGFIEAFQNLIHSLLAEGASALQKWRSELLHALKDQGQVIVEVIPEMEWIIGAQPTLPKLPYLENQQRFHQVFQRFIQTFAQADHPLVVFLDDLQWVDSGSLKLIEALFSGKQSHSLLLIVSYRDNETPFNHPWQQTLKTLLEGTTQVSTLPLSPLTDSHIGTWLKDTFSVSGTSIQQLAALIQTKTEGNPFFIREFLKSLHTQQLIRFDAQTNQWCWDIDQIRDCQITENVVEMLGEKLQRLSPSTLSILQLAACVGNRFDLKTLALLEKRSPIHIAQELKEALQLGHITPLNDQYQFVEFQDVNAISDLKIEYRFVHDRVQQSAYETLPAIQRPQRHWRIGQVLLESLAEEDQVTRLFDIINHLNAGISEITQDAERKTLIDMNLQAAQRAKKANAYSVAYDYVKIALNQLHQRSNPWHTHYSQTHAVYEEAVATAVLCSQYEDLRLWSNALLENAKTLLDCINTHQERLNAYMAQNRFADVMQEGLDALKSLGIQFPQAPEASFIQDALQEITPRLKSLSLDDLLTLPPMTDPHQLAAMQLLDKLYLSAFLVSPPLAVLISIKQVELALNFGYARESIPAYTSFAMNLYPLTGDIELSYRLGKLSLQLIDQKQELFYYPTVYLISAGFLLHWKESLHDLIPGYREAYRLGMEYGNHFGMVNCLFGHVSWKYLVGAPPLNIVERELAEATQTVHELKQEQALVNHQILWQVFKNLLDREPMPWKLKGEAYDEEKMVPLHQDAKQFTALFVVTLNKGTLCYWFEQHEEALNYLEQTFQNPFLSGTVYRPIAQMYLSLTQLALCSKSEPEEAAQLIEHVVSNQSSMKQWMEIGPANCKHRYLLVEAELARIQERFDEARELFDLAIEAAQQAQYPHEEAMACELAGTFYLSLNRQRVAHHYFQEAYYGYQKWGAEALTQKLENRFPQWFREVQSTLSHDIQTIDVTSVFKALQVLSEEIVLDKLLRKAMAIMIENAGAQIGCLLGPVSETSPVAESDSWQIEVFQGTETTPELPWKIINYVIHTKTYLVLNDASQEPRFQLDPYLQKYHPQSVLCAPILHQGKLVAILYLQNDLAPGVFTQNRVAILKYLSAQAAISLVNARLYAQQEKALALETQSRQALQEADRLKDEFLANTSHELRTPLYGMVGLAEALLEGGQDTFSSIQLGDLQTIVHSGKHLSVLLNDLLDFSKIRHRELRLQPRSVDLHHLGNLVLALCQGMTPKPEVALLNQIPTAFPLVHADENRLHQILFNLVSNAWKFTHRGEVVLMASHESQTVRISIRDTGLGIEPENMSQIFEAFQQADGSIAREYGGTGLGLAITQKLVELHGSHLEVDSQPGQGSTFSFSLPVATPNTLSSFQKNLTPLLAKTHLDLNRPPTEASSPNEASLQEAFSQEGKATIVVIEDNPINMRVVAQQLRQQQYVVHTALNGEEGLELVQEQMPDIVLLDLMMPRMSGYEVCQYIRKHYDNYQIPVIILTARNRVEDMVHALEVGANDYLSKPFSREELLARVNNQLEIKASVERLKENQQLKEEIARRIQKETEHRIAQRRLARILDSSEDGILCVQSNRKILFCNQTAESLLGFHHRDLINQPITPLLSLVEQEKFRIMLREHPNSESSGLFSTPLSLLTKGGQPCPYPAWVEPMAVEEDTIITLFLKPTTSQTAGAVSPSSVPVPPPGLAGAVSETLNLLKVGGPQVMGELREIDASLDEMGDFVLHDTPKDEKRRLLLVKILNATLRYWEESTQKTKIDLAEASGIWNVYEDYGTYRTRTLDKYLSLNSLPKYPRWRDVLRTAYFALEQCPLTKNYRSDLEGLIQQFRRLS